MGEYLPSVFRAFLEPDQRVTKDTLWAAESSYTEAGALPGVPAPQQDTDAVLVATGTQASGTVYDVVAVQGGMPGPTGMGIAWREDSDTYYRGWEPPVVITDWECADYTTSSDGNRFATPAPLPNGLLMVAYSQTSGANRVTRVRTGPDWSAATNVYTEAAVSSSYQSHPCAVPLPRGRVLLFFVTHNPTDTTMQVQMAYSDDSGATWSTGSTACLPAGIDYSTTTVTRLKAAHRDGQILLVLSLKDTAKSHDDYLVQYASADLGATFSLVEAWAGSSDATSAGYADVAANANGFFVAYILKGDLLPYCVRLGSAYQAISGGRAVAMHTGTIATKSTNVFTAGDLALVADERGSLWSFFRELGTAAYQGGGTVSHDHGATWAAASGYTTSGGSLWFTSNDASTYPTEFRGCWYQGRAVLAHRWAANPGNEDNSLGFLYLGGQTTQTMPSYQRGKMAQWKSETWMPFDLPTDVGWSVTGTATTEALESPGILHVATSSNVRQYYITGLSGSIAQGQMLEFGFARTAGTVQVAAILADGTNDYNITVRMGTSGNLVLRDVNASADIATVAVTTTSTQIVRVFMAAGKVSAWYRQDDDTDRGDRVWAVLADNEALTSNTGTPGASGTVSFGTSSSGTHDVTFTRFFYSEGISEQASLVAAGQTNPDDLYGMPLSTVPTYITGASPGTTTNGLSLTAVDGPAYIGDVWKVTARYDYGIGNLLITEASHARQWRTTSTATQTVSWQVDETAAAWTGSTLMGLYLESNAPGASFAWGASSSWNTTSVNRRLSSVTFTRKGESVTPQKHGGASPVFVEANELVGAHFAFSSGTVARKIIANTSGMIAPTTGDADAGPRVRLYLEGVAGSELSSGSAGAIYWPRTLTVIDMGEEWADGFQMEIVLNSWPAPSEGYFWAKALIGPVFPLGWQNSANRVVTHRRRMEASEDPVGRLRSRAVSPVRREWTLNWEQVDERPLLAGSDDYISGISGGGVAFQVGLRRDMARRAVGMLRRMEGSATPFAYVPNLPPISGSTTLLLPRADAPAAVQMIGDMQVRTAMGDEGVDELLSFGMTLREVV